MHWDIFRFIFFKFYHFRLRFFLGTQIVSLSIEFEPVSIEFFARQLSRFNDLFYLLIRQAKQHILGFEISVNHSANAVQEIQTHQHLTTYFLHHVQRETFVIISFEDFQKIDPQDFKHHAEVVAVGPLVEERVEEVEYVAIVSVVVLFIGFVDLEGLNPLGMICVAGHFLQDFNLSWL